MLEQLGLTRVREQLSELGLMIVGIVLAFAGAFAPWYRADSAEFGFDSAGASFGINNDDGKLVLIVVAVAVWLLVSYADGAKGRLLGLLGCGLVIALTALASIIAISGGLVSTWGLWMVGVGGVFLTLGALMVANVRALENDPDTA